MKKLSMNLTNCHGIRQLSTEFDFSSAGAVAIYAPNGMMKTSFSRTFKDFAQGKTSADRMFPDRITERLINDEAGNPLPPDGVVVVLSYDEEVGPTESTSTLLVNAELRREYEALQSGVNAARSELVAALKKHTGTKKDIARCISLAFTSDDESFFVALLRIYEEIAGQETAPYVDVPYDVVFDDKVVALLRTEEFRSALSEYVGRLNDLLESSMYFDQANFNYYNAVTVAKSLAANGFFKAKHAVVLHAGENTEEIVSEKQLGDLVEAEKQGIIGDETLRATFVNIEKQLMKNAETRKFSSYISGRVELLPELENIGRFDELVWKSYLKENWSLYENAVECYRSADKRKREIERIAAEQSTRWEEVIEIFNQRFFVPFKLTAKNREKVMLGQEKVLELVFEFKDGVDHVSVNRGELLAVLSNGEKKALYILNVLFEVEARRESSQETLFVIDDIADSFDYKNKYAIIQYLKDMSDEDYFRLIILTHNFDFFRTLESRFIPYSQCRMAQKDSKGVSLLQAEGVKNPFVYDFKPKFFTTPMKRVASIPFIRNLLEYTRGLDNPDYLALTSLLHWKTDSQTIQQSDLDRIFGEVFGGSGQWSISNEAVVDFILAQADECLNGDASVNFDYKIVLSIAIRLGAEKFMVAQIADLAFTDEIGSNQTPVLFTEYKRKFPTEIHTHRILDSVILMTPENIHVNAFMYEPILDMSDDHLRKLYEAVKSLGSS